MSCIPRLLRRVIVGVVLFSLFAAGAAGAEKLPPPPPFVPGSWTMVLLPDTQMYAQDYPGLFTMQTHWIVNNRDRYNIRYVVTLGDITNLDTDVQWQHARDAITELDGHVPYVLVAGNHDYTPHGDVVHGRSGLNKFFSPAQFRDWPSFGGAMKPNDITNSYHLFRAGGIDWIILALEWSPRNATIAWANEVLAKYPERKAILVTHAYLYDDGTRYDWAKKGKSQDWNPHDYAPKAAANDGEELWQKLVRQHNFALTLNGHVCHTGLGFLSSKNDHGKTTHQMLVDYQERPLGGEGYLRILEFRPDKTVQVKSYSPFYDKYLRDAGNQFTFKLDP